ncbi:MAG: hypothetical protein IJ699_09720, partial [Bacteroidaceae bacterium]|nr:hypothetical protein [Bacteroidaceae bacterium]
MKNGEKSWPHGKKNVILSAEKATSGLMAFSLHSLTNTNKYSIMKSFLLRGLLLNACLTLSCLFAFTSFLQGAVMRDKADDGLVVRFVDDSGAPILRASSTLPEVIRLHGTGAEATVTVSATGLSEDISLRVGSGFEVSPTTIKAGTESTKVTVRHLSTLRHAESRLILRSGDIRTYVNIIAEGTPLPSKDISSLPTTASSASGQVFGGSSAE